MLGRIMRLGIYGVGVTALLTAGATPASAASTEGSTTTTFDQCVTQEEFQTTYCMSGTERRVEVHTAAGVVVIQGEGDFSSTTSYPGGETSSEGTRRYVTVWGSSIEGPDGVIYFDRKVVRSDGVTTLTTPDGMNCTFDMNYVIANETGGYDHRSVTCTAP